MGTHLAFYLVGLAALAAFYGMLAISVYRQVAPPRYRVSEAEKRSMEAAEREARAQKEFEDSLNLPDNNIAAIMTLRRMSLTASAPPPRD